MAGHDLAQKGSRMSIMIFGDLGPSMTIVRGSQGSVWKHPVMLGGFPYRGSSVGPVLADLVTSAAEPK